MYAMLGQDDCPLGAAGPWPQGPLPSGTPVHTRHNEMLRVRTDNNNQSTALPPLYLLWRE
jgi:hypothetical protein